MVGVGVVINASGILLLGTKEEDEGDFLDWRVAVGKEKEKKGNLMNAPLYDFYGGPSLLSICLGGSQDEEPFSSAKSVDEF